MREVWGGFLVITRIEDGNREQLEREGPRSP